MGGCLGGREHREGTHGTDDEDLVQMPDVIDIGATDLQLERVVLEAAGVGVFADGDVVTTVTGTDGGF